MNIGENKKVLALSVVFALAFGGVMYLGYDYSDQAATAKEKLEEINIAFEDYNAAEFPPTANSEKIIKEATKEVAVLKEDLESQLESYRKASATDKGMSPVEFQNKLRDSISTIGARAKEADVKLGTQAAALGMAAYQNNAAIKGEVPCREFLLRSVANTLNLLMDAKAPVIDKVFCEKFPAGAIDDLASEGDYFPLSFELSFSIKRGTLPTFINALLADKNFFYTITGISTQSDVNVPQIDKYKAPPTVIATAGDEDEAPAPAASRTIATRAMGNPEETAHVHLTMQVLFFNPYADKK